MLNFVEIFYCQSAWQVTEVKPQPLKPRKMGDLYKADLVLNGRLVLINGLRPIPGLKLNISGVN